MPRYVALLRAINVGGHVVEMKHLKRMFDGLGFTDVATFIASGNVAFSAAPCSTRALEGRIATRLARTLGYAVATFVRTPAELEAIATHRAFAAPAPGSSLYIGFLGARPGKGSALSLAGLATDGDALHLNDRELYWRCNHTLSPSRMTGARLERALGQPTTWRKSTTVEELAAKFA